MASTNFLQHNPAQANQENDAQFSSDTQRTGGFGNGDIVPSSLLNKELYQATTMARAIGLMMANKGYSTSDADVNQLATVLGHIVTSDDIQAGLITVPFASSIAFNAAAALGFEVTLSGNVFVSTLINVTPGQILKFVIRQDAAGNRAFAWPANVFGASIPDLSPNAVSIQSLLVCADAMVRPFTPMTVS